VIDLATAGRKHHEIAEILGISQAAVSKIAEREDKRWARENQHLIQRHKVDLLRKYERVYREAMDAWQASKAQRTRRRQRKSGVGDGDTMAEVVIDDSHGDSRYLDIARRALADRARLLGLDGLRETDGTDEVVEITLDIPSLPTASASVAGTAKQPGGSNEDH
jgi:hypothetical protein